LRLSLLAFSENFLFQKSALVAGSLDFPHPPMVVLEAPVDKDDLAVLREDDVGAARKGADMQAEAEAQPVRHAPHNSLQSRVMAVDAGHDLAALFPGEYVRYRVVL